MSIFDEENMLSIRNRLIKKKMPCNGTQVVEGNSNTQTIKALRGLTARPKNLSRE